MKNEWAKANALKFFLALAAMLLLMLAVRAWAFTIYRVNTSDFRPELLNGDRVMVNRLKSAFDKGDFIVFGGDSCLIGKVKATPGDTIAVDGKQYMLPTHCPLCGNSKHRYYMISVGGRQTLIHQTDIVGTAYRVWPINR